MAAITWRNVGGGDTNGALRNLIAAGQGVTNSFDSLRGVVGDMEKADKQNFDRQKETNTNTFLDALQSRYKSPEELQAAIKSGEIDQFQQSFGKNINSGAARGAADARLTSLRQQGLAGMQYDNQVTDNADQAALSRATAAAYSPDPKVRAAAQEEAATISDRNKGKATQNIFQAERDLFGFGVEKNKEVRAGEAHKMDLRKGEAAINSSNASAAASRASAANSSVRTQLAQVELSDAQSARVFSKEMQNDVRQHQVNTAAEKAAIREVAKQAGPSMVPVDKNGDPDLNRMDKGQIDAFNGLLAPQKLSTRTYTDSDTDAAQRSIDKLYRNGAPQAVIDKAKANIGEWYNTAAPAAIGNSAATKAQKERQQALLDQRVNDAAGGIPLKSGEFSDAMKIIGPAVPKKNGDLINRAIAQYFTTGGVEVDGQKRYLPANVISQIVQQQEDTWHAMVPLNSARRDTLSALQKAEKDFGAKLKASADAETDKMVRSVNSGPSSSPTAKGTKKNN